MYTCWVALQFSVLVLIRVGGVVASLGVVGQLPPVLLLLFFAGVEGMGPLRVRQLGGRRGLGLGTGAGARRGGQEGKFIWNSMYNSSMIKTISLGSYSNPGSRSIPPSYVGSFWNSFNLKGHISKIFDCLELEQCRFKPNSALWNKHVI